MMKERTIYIPPASEDYTGYTTFVISGTSTSELEAFWQQGEEISPVLVQGDEKEWVEEKPLGVRMVEDPFFGKLVEQGLADIEQGRYTKLDEVKRKLGDI